MCFGGRVLFEACVSSAVAECYLFEHSRPRVGGVKNVRDPAIVRWPPAGHAGAVRLAGGPGAC